MGVLEDNKALIRAHFDAIWSGDEGALRQQLGAEFVDHAAPPGAPRGIDAVIEMARGMRATFPDMTVTIEQSLAEGDRVAVHCAWRGTHEAPFLGIAASHKQITFTGMVFWQVLNHKIVGRRATLDLAAVMRQLQS